jgi:lycopene cyclase domain-containing protein
MTYGQFLIVFLLVPIAGLALLVVRDGRHSHMRERRWRGKSAIILLGCLGIVAMVYTIPWDNHLIADGVWWYDGSLVSGVTLGQIPIEEVLFFPLQTLLVWLWMMWLMPRVTTNGLAKSGSDAMNHESALSGTIQKVGIAAATPPQVRACTGVPRAGIANARWIVALAGVGVCLVSLVILRSGWRPGTYLAWELVWALPPLILQFGVGGDILWQHRRLLLAVIVPAVAYLSGADAIAIHGGIWTISPHQSLGLLLVGLLPVEEFIFFLMTSTLVACGLILGGAPELRRRFTYRISHWPQS